MEKAIVIGAGVAGIASAIRLAVQGFQVEVYEANAYPGGKLSEFLCEGYRFDAGPSLFTMPEYVDELFLLAGRDPRTYFNYTKLDPVCRYYFEDGTRLSSSADPEELARDIAGITCDSAESVLRFLRNSSRIYDITHHIFLEKSLHKISSYLDLKTLRSILRLPAIDSFRTMAKANASFFRDSKTRRFFNRFATYNGSNPYKAPATLNVIPHLEMGFGAYFPEGGMNSITEALVHLAEELGVIFRYNSPVEGIFHTKGRVDGITVRGEEIKADLIVSNIDVCYVYKKLLKQEPQASRILKQERSSSALIFYWGVSRSFSELGLHNIFFSEDYEAEFDCIWKKKEISSDPTVYVNISSKLNKQDAPEGCENWFVMINTPSNDGQSWDRLVDEAREQVIGKIGRNLKVDLRKFLVCERVLDPRSIERTSGAFRGSLYGTSSNNRFSAFFRHPNFSSSIKGLYFVGGSVHPGGGIPLALLSARITGELIRKAKR